MGERDGNLAKIRTRESVLYLIEDRLLTSHQFGDRWTLITTLQPSRNIGEGS
jgi:hypothetical protein